MPKVMYFSRMKVFTALLTSYLIGLGIQGRVLRASLCCLQISLKSLSIANTVLNSINQMIEFVSGNIDTDLKRSMLVYFDDNVCAIRFFIRNETTNESPPIMGEINVAP